MPIVTEVPRAEYGGYDGPKDEENDKTGSDANLGGGGWGKTKRGGSPHDYSSESAGYEVPEDFDR